MTLSRPETARIANHTTMAGPNRRPMACVPNCWIANSTVSRASVIGTTNDFSPGADVSSPSTEEMTLIAGVIVPSPKKSATPKIPSKTRAAFLTRPLTRRRWTSATSAIMPPSPRLSARITKVMYLTMTTRMIVQTMSEIMPSTPPAFGRTPWTRKMELIAYRGLVPMSPKTTPSAPRVRAAVPALAAVLLPSRRAGPGPCASPSGAGTCARVIRARLLARQPRGSHHVHLDR